MQLCILYIPIFHRPFKITYPSIQDWMLGLISALAVFALIELVKEIALAISKRSPNL